MALVGIQTAISSLGNSISAVFSPLGANQFSITDRDNSFDSDDNVKPNPRIEYDETELFKEAYNYPGKVTAYMFVPGANEIRYRGEKTNPNYSIIGGDEHFIELENHTLKDGRNFTNTEIQNGAAVAIIGSAMVDDLFEDQVNIIGESIHAKNQRYRIIGILDSKGNSFNSSDRLVVIPSQNVNRFFSDLYTNYTIKVGVQEAEDIQPAIAEAYGAMRLARGLRTIDDNNFAIRDPGATNDDFVDLINKVSMGGLLIGLITLVGAGIGLMNILLVSVTERIREIGVSKAIGATSGNISLQYFIEGIVISLIGGFMGIIFGLLIGLLVAKLTKSVFMVPWDWVALGVVICLVVGLLSSIFPAYKAARLNPIEALRNDKTTSWYSI